MTDAEDFGGQAGIVTGAGEGIGLEIARQLALRGARVMLNDVDEAKAQQAAATIREAGGECVGVGGDVGDTETVRGLVTQAVARFGQLDIAVANAGITLWGSFLDFTPENFNRVLAVNLGGSFFLAQAAARHMRDRGTGGRILFMSSVSGHQAIEYLSAYGMTKAALEMLARQLVSELGPLGITVNAVVPGATVTPRNLRDDPNYDAVWGAITPTRRTASTSEIARAALFLLSPAAGQITGQTITVDGGWTATSPIPTLGFIDDHQSQDHEDH